MDKNSQAGEPHIVAGSIENGFADAHAPPNHTGLSAVASLIIPICKKTGPWPRWHSPVTEPTRRGKKKEKRENAMENKTNKKDTSVCVCVCVHVNDVTGRAPVPFPTSTTTISLSRFSETSHAHTHRKRERSWTLPRPPTPLTQHVSSLRHAHREARTEDPMDDRAPVRSWVSPPPSLPPLHPLPPPLAYSQPNRRIEKNTRANPIQVHTRRNARG